MSAQSGSGFSRSGEMDKDAIGLADDLAGYFDEDWLRADPDDDDFKAAVELTRWKVPGPVSQAYIECRDEVKALVGPYGSGKTSTVLNSEVMEAIRSPQCLDGVRRYSLLVLRDNYRQLYKTAVRTWHEWYPPQHGDWKGGSDRPAEHKLTFQDEYGLVKMHVMFAAIPETDIQAFMDGFEVSAIFLNAAPSMPRDVLTYGLGRIGRDPPQRRLPDGCAIYRHVSMDANKTEDDHWFYDLCENGMVGEDGVAEKIGFFDMPGGMEPDAENRENLAPGYYESHLKRQPKWWCRINVHNKWGPSRKGTPVYDDYDPDVHDAREDFSAVKEQPLILMMDAGTATAGHPACIFAQAFAGPSVKAIDELYIGRAGPSRFIDALLSKLDEPHLRPAAHNLLAYLDPSAFGQGDQDSGESTWLDLAEKGLGISINCPISNALHDFRIPTIETLLRLRGGLIISPRCTLLRRGFASAYHYEKRETRAGVSEKPQPAKNDASHPHDALQHGVTGHFGSSLIEGQMRQRARQSNHDSFNGGSMIAADFNPLDL
jgi:hypothetical protein